MIAKALTAAVALLAALTGTSGVAYADPDVLERTTRWNADYDEDACHLAAGFGEDGSEVTMRLTTYGTGNVYRGTFAGRRFRSRANFTPVRVGFGSGEQMIERSGIYAGSGDFNVLLVSGLRLDNRDLWGDESDPTLPEITAAQEAAVDYVQVEGRGWRAVRLTTGPMDRPIAALRACVRACAT